MHEEIAESDQFTLCYLAAYTSGGIANSFWFGSAPMLGGAHGEGETHVGLKYPVIGDSLASHLTAPRLLMSVRRREFNLMLIVSLLRKSRKGQFCSYPAVSLNSEDKTVWLNEQ